MTLTEFLLAQLEADEQVVLDGSWSNDDDPRELTELTPDDWREGWRYLTIHPARVLAECAAKRGIIRMHDLRTVEWIGGDVRWTCTCQGGSRMWVRKVGNPNGKPPRNARMNPQPG